MLKTESLNIKSVHHLITVGKRRRLSDLFFDFKTLENKDLKLPSYMNLSKKREP